MAWRIYTRETSGDADVSSAPNREAAIARAQALLVQGLALIRIESDDGEIIEGKQLQEVLVGSRTPGSQARH